MNDGKPIQVESLKETPIATPTVAVVPTSPKTISTVGSTREAIKLGLKRAKQRSTQLK